MFTVSEDHGFSVTPGGVWFEGNKSMIGIGGHVFEG